MTGRPHGEIICRDLVELVTDYLEGSMPAEQRLRLEEHLAFCSPCIEYMAQMRETIRLMGEIREDDLDPESRELMLRAIQGFRP